MTVWLIWLAACVGLAPAQEQSDQQAALQAVATQYLNTYQASSGSTAVSLLASTAPGAPNISVQAGSLSLQPGQPLNPNTPYEIGSITKSFTSVLILKLEAAGVLSIQDTLDKWLPQYPIWSSYTIQQLLNMTAYTDDYQFNYFFHQVLVSDIHRTWAYPDEISYVYPAGLPQQPYFYSNVNYTLLAMIIEKATGMSYAEALKKMLFEPLGLHDVYYQPAVPPARLLAAMPSGYDYFCTYVPQLVRQDVKTVNLSVYNGAGGIIATLPEVARWVRLLFGDTLLPPQQKQELFSLVSKATGKPIETTSPSDPAGYALGLGQNWANGSINGPIWGYEGETLGYRVEWALRPSDPLLIVAGANSSVADDNDNLASLYLVALNVFEPQNPAPVFPPAPTTPPCPVP